MKSIKFLHGLYLALVGLLLAYLTYREVNYRSRMAYEAAVMAPIVEQLSAQHRDLTNEVAKEAESYRNPHNQAILRTATRADSLKTVLVAWLDSLVQVDSARYRHTALYQYDCFVKDLPLSEPVSPALRHQIQYGAPNTAKAVLLGLTASALSASLSAQERALGQIFSEDRSLDALMPYVNADKPAIAGKPFTALIYPIYYTTRYDSICVPYVNGNAYKFERGLANFQEILQKRGERRYFLRWEDRNPLTGEIKVRDKTVEVKVR